MGREFESLTVHQPRQALQASRIVPRPYDTSSVLERLRALINIEERPRKSKTAQNLLTCKRLHSDPLDGGVIEAVAIGSLMAVNTAV